MSTENRGNGLRLNERRRNTTPVALAAGIGVVALAAIALRNRASGDKSEIAAPMADAATPKVHLVAARPTATPQIYAARDIPKWAKGREVSSVPVSPKDKVFALTFDDGPWPEYTRKILAILKENNVKATFFMVGQEVMRRPEIAREVRDAGHAIGNHSWDHPSRPRDPIMQVMRTDAMIKKELGFRPTIFRPPYGIMKNGMAKQAMKLNDPILLWSADSNDWKKPGADVIVRNVVGEAHSGGISLMHDGGGARYQDVEALPTIISQLRAQGYRFVTIPELLKLRDEKAAAQEAVRKANKKSGSKAKKHKKKKH